MGPSVKNVMVIGGFLLLALGVIQWSPALASWPQSPTVSARVKKLEDIEAIKTLKHRYIVAIDDVIADPAASEDFVDLFVDDFVVEYDEFGTFSDKGSLTFFLENVISPAFSWGFHAAHNPRIVVEGDHATGEWYFTADAVYAGTTEAVPFYGRYVDHYVRTCDGWRIQSTILEFDSPPMME